MAIKMRSFDFKHFHINLLNYCVYQISCDIRDPPNYNDCLLNTK